MSNIKYSTKKSVSEVTRYDLYDSPELAVDSLGILDYDPEQHAHLVLEVDLDSEEYILRDIPKEFHPFLSSLAWDQGHSAGEDEVRLHLRSFVGDYGLKECIAAYTGRLKDA
jgi:hypothetical protein